MERLDRNYVHTKSLYIACMCVECAGSKPQVPDMPCDQQQQTAQLDSETHIVPPVYHGTGSAVQSTRAEATDTITSTGGNSLVLMLNRFFLVHLLIYGL